MLVVTVESPVGNVFGFCGYFYSSRPGLCLPPTGFHRTDSVITSWKMPRRNTFLHLSVVHKVHKHCLLKFARLYVGVARPGINTLIHMLRTPLMPSSLNIRTHCTVDRAKPAHCFANVSDKFRDNMPLKKVTLIDVASALKLLMRIGNGK